MINFIREYPMRYTSFCLTVLLFLTMLNISSSLLAKEVPDPTEQLRPFVDRIVAILTDPDLQGEEKCVTRRDRVMEVASERFDFMEMSKRVLGSTWRKLNEEDKKYFTSLFRRLLEHAYIGKIEDYSKQKVEFRDQRIRGDRAQVMTTVVDKDANVSVSYIMLLEGDKWMVYDIVVEGVSLIRNYMEQFKEILRKDGYDKLLVQLEDKVTELEESIGRACPVEIIERRGA